jgi:hypothetical protein
MKPIVLILAVALLIGNLAWWSPASAAPPQPARAGQAQVALNPNPPDHTVKLIFIHHSTGEAWLGDGYGNLAIALRDNHYFVSDTNYGWGPDSIGSSTDIGHWNTWFRGASSAAYLSALFTEYGKHSTYSRLATDPGGANQIILFKSCFPNSGLQGNLSDPIPTIGNNPLRGQPAGSAAHTVSNAKGIYIDLLNYFSAHQEKLFVVIAAPPLSSGTYATNARSFNNWLVNDWLASYPYANVAVFDYYTVLTSNGGSATVNDLGAATGNHHRLYNGAIQHLASGSSTLAYPTGDDHPSAAGDQKATAEFLPLLNIFYHRWQASLAAWQYFYLPMVRN